MCHAQLAQALAGRGSAPSGSRRRGDGNRARPGLRGRLHRDGECRARAREAAQEAGASRDALAVDPSNRVAQVNVAVAGRAKAG